MSNGIKTSVKGNKLIIEIDMSPRAVAAAPLSSTGKTRLLATTGGALPIEGCPIANAKLALNVMIPVDAAEVLAAARGGRAA